MKIKIFCIFLFFLSVSFLFTCSKEIKRPRNIILITLDTTRAGSLGCYGNKKICTKHIDKMAKNGILFENAASHAPETLPSHSSIMTSLFPPYHGVRNNSIYRLGANQTTLAEILKENRFKTAAFIGSFILDSQFGLNQGFDVYNDKFIAPKQKGRLPVDRRGEEISRLAAKWIEGNFKNRFFLWLHYYDPHADYDPPEPFKGAYSENLYDGEIAYTDMCIGLIFKKLKKLGILGDTLIVITADHGESLGEHDEQTHGFFVYNSTTHVPLILNYQELEIKNKRIDKLVRSVDIMPTILDLLNIPLKNKIQGRSLLPLIKGTEKWDEEYSYSEAEIPKSFYWNGLKSLRDSRWKYIHASNPELYDLKNDPGELKNLMAEKKDKADELKKILQNLFASVPGSRGKENILPIDQETADKLKSLGYFQGGGTSGKEGEDVDIDNFTRPDPKEMIRVYNKFQIATALSDQKKNDDAVKLFQEIIHDDPSNPRFILNLGELYYDNGMYDKAINEFKKAIKIEPEDSRFYFLLGNVYNKRGSVLDAIKEYKSAIKFNPRHFMAHYNLGRIYTLQHKDNDAVREYNEALKIRPAHSFSLNNLAYIYIEKYKDFNKAIEYLKQAASYAPDAGFIFDNLGNALYEKGNVKDAIPNFIKAIEIEKNNPIYFIHLGDCYKKLGEKEKAEIYWEKALAIAPDNIEAKKRLN